MTAHATIEETPALPRRRHERSHLQADRSRECCSRPWAGSTSPQRRLPSLRSQASSLRADGKQAAPASNRPSAAWRPATQQAGRPAYHRRPRHEGRPDPRRGKPETVSETAPPVRRATRPGGRGRSPPRWRRATLPSPNASRTRSKAWPATSAPKRSKPPPALWRNSFATSAAAAEVESGATTSRRRARSVGRAIAAPRWVRPRQKLRRQPAASAPVDPAQVPRSRGAVEQAAFGIRSRRGGFHRGKPGRSCVRCSPAKPGRQFEKLVQGYSFADAQAQLEQALKNFSPRMKTEFHLGKLPKQKNDENQVLRLTETFSSQTERQNKTQNK